MVRWHGDPYQAGGLRGGAAEVSLGIREGKNGDKKDLIYKIYDDDIVVTQNLL